jgi:diphthamide synthase subunit DPH2
MYESDMAIPHPWQNKTNKQFLTVVKHQSLNFVIYQQQFFFLFVNQIPGQNYRLLENVATRNIFWVICDDFFFWLQEIVTGSSNIIPEFTFGTGLHF